MPNEGSGSIPLEARAASSGNLHRNHRKDVAAPHDGAMEVGSGNLDAMFASLMRSGEETVSDFFARFSGLSTIEQSLLLCGLEREGDDVAHQWCPRNNPGTGGPPSRCEATAAHPFFALCGGPPQLVGSLVTEGGTQRDVGLHTDASQNHVPQRHQDPWPQRQDAREGQCGSCPPKEPSGRGGSTRPTWVSAMRAVTSRQMIAHRGAALQQATTSALCDTETDVEVLDLRSNGGGVCSSNEGHSGGLLRAVFSSSPLDVELAMQVKFDTLFDVSVDEGEHGCGHAARVGGVTPRPTECEPPNGSPPRLNFLQAESSGEDDIQGELNGPELASSASGDDLLELPGTDTVERRGTSACDHRHDRESASEDARARGAQVAASSRRRWTADDWEELNEIIRTTEDTVEAYALDPYFDYDSHLTGVSSRKPCSSPATSPPTVDHL